MIINKTKKMPLAKNYKLCKSTFSKIIGLMFSRKKPDFGLIMEFKKPSRPSLHTLFVFYPIDLLFLNERKKAIEIKENLTPFKLFIPKSKVKFILEFPAGTLNSSNIELLDTISFEI